MAARSKKTRTLKSNGNKGYGLSYALSTIRANPFRAISLALTLSLGISLFASTMVWGDTGVYVSIYEHLEQNPFQVAISTSAGDLGELALAESYLQSSPFIESTYRLNSTIGLVWGTELPDSKVYDIGGYVYSDGMKDCQVFFIDNEFLNLTYNEFWHQGASQLQTGEILVTSLFIHNVRSVFNLTLEIGDIIDIELLTGEAAVAPIGDLGRLSLTDLRIVGTYDPVKIGGLMELALPTVRREHWNQTNIRYPVLGLRDSVMILKDSIPPDSLSENGFFEPVVFGRVSSSVLAANGPENVASNLFGLMYRTEELYEIEWLGTNDINDMQDSINTYVSTLSLSVLALPVILLALFFSVFAADAFMAPRTVEVGIIRSKGASYSQVSTIFLWETLLISSFAVLMGVIFSILFAPLIPASTNFMTFDWSIYFYYISKTVLTSNTTLRAITLTVLPSMLFILYRARRAAQTEIGLTLMEVEEETTEQAESHGFTIGASIVLLGIVILLIFILPKTTIFFWMELSFGTAAWFFIAYNGSRLSRVGLAKVSEKLSFVLGQKNLISAGYLKMRKGRIIPLMVVLTLTMSSTIAFAVQSESLRVDLGREINYSIGADLRIDCTARELSYNDTIGAYDGIESVMPVLRTWAKLGPEQLTVEAIYPLQYTSIGHFDESSFPDREPEEILSALAAVSNGIIISDFHATIWNKTVGDSLTMEMSGVGTNQWVVFEVVGVVHSAPGFGYATAAEIPYSSQGTGFGYQAGYNGFVLANMEFIQSKITNHQTSLFLASLGDDANQTQLIDDLRLLPGIYPNTPESFDLKSHSLYTALFLNTVEGLFSIGFVMSLILSIFALSISLGSVVRERRKEYAVIRAIGGSRSQVVSMVFSEFTGVVLASLALSLILGAVFGFVMQFLLNNMSPFSRVLATTISFPMQFLSIVLLIEILTMIIGAYLPAREAARTEPAVVLRNM
ncbi:MAG: FtsX-like permease family protein [Candidatus Thorarchaeota archaeon]|nr:FtsX-like permease family protein [Candidatus Thorarchaeota archaeon]